jgi:hypothetical protein
LSGLRDRSAWSGRCDCNRDEAENMFRHGRLAKKTKQMKLIPGRQFSRRPTAELA